MSIALFYAQADSLTMESLPKYMKLQDKKTALSQYLHVVEQAAEQDFSSAVAGMTPIHGVLF